MYATQEEDRLFRNDKSDDEVGNTRIIMHKNTNIGLPTASDGDQQRLIIQLLLW